MQICDFRDLDVWKLGKNLVIEVYQSTSEFPKDELFGLVSQMRRAAVSVPSNIAEGYNRSYTKDYQRFLSMALGSCGELETQVEIASDLEYIGTVKKQSLLENINHEARMLRNLIKSL